MAPMKKVMKAMKVKMSKAMQKINSKLKGRKAAEEDVKYSGLTAKEKAAAKKAEAAAKKAKAGAKAMNTMKAMKTMKAQKAGKGMKAPIKAMKADPAEKPGKGKQGDKKGGKKPKVDMSQMSLDEKIKHYMSLKPAEQNIDNFLSDLSEKDNQRLWQRYAYARRTDEKAQKSNHGLLICCFVVCCCCNHEHFIF